MFTSYFLTKLARKDFVPIITVFIILVSFFSAYFPASGPRARSHGIILVFPFSFLSFPFYDFIDEVFVEPVYWVEVHRIRFFTVDITSSPSMVGLINMQSISIFSFFLLVNILGALLGYWIGKRRRIPHFSSMWSTVFGLVSVGLGSVLIIIGAGHFIGENIGMTLFGFGILLLETIILSKLGKLAVDFFTPYT